MKIAHIGNTAGIPSTIALEQSKRGHIVDVFTFDDLTEKMFGGSRINYNSYFEKFWFHRKLNSYEIWHYHYPHGTLKKNLEKQRKKAKLLKHYHGSDIRTEGTIDNDFCLVSTPDLLKFTPNGIWLPNPLDLDLINKFKISNSDGNGPLRIAHYPYYEINRQLPDNYSQVFSSLASLTNCTFTKISGIAHSDALKMISESDIVVGKIMPEMGWFSTFELEGMALKKPIIAYISDELYEKYKPPVFRTSIATFKQGLLSLIEDENVRRELGSAGFEYVKKYHSCDKIVNVLDNCYKKIIG
jgi:hypothetical protein